MGGRAARLGKDGNGMSKQHDSGAAPLALTGKVSRWNYERSVEKMRPLVKGWKKATIDMLRELYLAKEYLTTQKGQYKDPEADDYLIYSWSGYCGEIGLSYQTANSWLRMFQFKPRELSETGRDALLALEAPLKEDTAASRALMQARVAEVLRTGNRPAGFSDKEEAELKRQLKNAELARITAQAVKYNTLAVSKTKDYFGETLKHAKDTAKFSLDNHIQNMAQMEIFKNIAAYLETFEDIEIRSRAAFNIALKARNIFNGIAEVYFQLSESAAGGGEE